MRLEWLVLALLCGSAAGCDPTRCRDQTIYLTIDYTAQSSTSDTLALDVTVGGARQHYQRPRTPGGAHDTLEVVFQRYPAGQTVSLSATALLAGQAVGNGQMSAALAPRCSALSLPLVGDGDPSDAGIGGGLDESMSGGGGSDFAMASRDLGHAGDMATTAPVVSFAGLDNTAQSPAGTDGALYEDRCPAGYALIGFNFSATNEIDNDKPVCARADLVPAVGGGWQAVWGPTVFLPYHGPAQTGDPGTQRLCPNGAFVRGFTGTSAVYLQSVLMICSSIVVSADKKVTLSANGYSTTFGPSAGANFGPYTCPTNEVATMRRERQDTNIPAYAFGLACSAISVD